VEQYQPQVKKASTKRLKAKANRKRLTPTSVLRLPVSERQHFVWDAGTDAVRGLCVLVNPTGTKTFMVNYRFPGSPRLHYKSLGRVGEVSLEDARAAARAARKAARDGRDPKADDPSRSDAFKTVWQDYIQREQISRKQNKSALKTSSLVLHHFAEWKPRAVATLAYREISAALATKSPATAERLHAHLGDFFKWCAREQIITASPMVNMPAPAKSAPRDRFYSDAELQAIWKAAEQLSPVEASYIKLMMLLGLRRNELALARWDEFAHDLTLFTVPTERIKLKASAKVAKRPVYKVPLPPLAQRILGLRRDGELVFPGLDADKLKAKLTKLGAPQDFKLHTFRHSTATWLQNQGRSEWEVGLVLNHSGSGSVTGGYSHGYPIERKLDLLKDWADHVEGLTTAAGVSRLR